MVVAAFVFVDDFISVVGVSVFYHFDSSIVVYLYFFIKRKLFHLTTKTFYTSNGFQSK